MAVPKEKYNLSASAYIIDGNLLFLPNQDGTLLQQIYVNMSADI